MRFRNNQIKYISFETKHLYFVYIDEKKLYKAILPIDNHSILSNFIGKISCPNNNVRIYPSPFNLEFSSSRQISFETPEKPSDKLRVIIRYVWRKNVSNLEECFKDLEKIGLYDERILDFPTIIESIRSQPGNVNTNAICDLSTIKKWETANNINCSNRKHGNKTKQPDPIIPRLFLIFCGIILLILIIYFTKEIVDKVSKPLCLTGSLYGTKDYYVDS
ncbi:hypothetical protein SNEBB_002331 [Seison nebaliae]|nr:hypothetical protein SNEBB_002331 [Seison nebaliae]